MVWWKQSVIPKKKATMENRWFRWSAVKGFMCRERSVNLKWINWKWELHWADTVMTMVSALPQKYGKFLRIHPITDRTEPMHLPIHLPHTLQMQADLVITAGQNLRCWMRATDRDKESIWRNLLCGQKTVSITLWRTTEPDIWQNR